MYIYELVVTWRRLVLCSLLLSLLSSLPSLHSWFFAVTHTHAHTHTTSFYCNRRLCFFFCSNTLNYFFSPSLSFLSSFATFPLAHPPTLLLSISLINHNPISSRASCFSSSSSSLVLFVWMVVIDCWFWLGWTHCPRFFLSARQQNNLLGCAKYISQRGHCRFFLFPPSITTRSCRL